MARHDDRLCRLLRQYAAGNAVDREVWQDRLMDWDGLDARTLTFLHGELLAQGWVELNTGVAPSCYRVTIAGVRALKRLETHRDDDLLDAAA